jgi:molybdopterin-guanine dinucleotide biosynthesis protein A
VSRDWLPEDAPDLLSDPTTPVDPWRTLLLAADVHVLENDWRTAELLQHQAWQLADGRGEQGATLHRIGHRLWRHGDRDGAAAFFEVARALRHGFAAPDLVASSEQMLLGLRAETRFDAIVLSGGRGARMGGAKPERRLAGWPLLDHVLLALSGASRRVVVGPVRRGLGQPEFAEEDPPGAGPVAGIAAALDAISSPYVAVMAADVPFVRSALGELRTQLRNQPARDVAALIDVSGRVNYLASLWRTSSLRLAIAELGDPKGLAVRALYEKAEITMVPDFDEVGADVDTPNDLALAEERIWQPDWASSHLRPDQSQDWLPATPLAWPGLELHAPS